MDRCGFFQKVLVSCFFPMLLIGCVHKLTAIDAAVQRQWLPFLEDGKTNRAEVLSSLGQPSARFQGERILTYRMMLDSEKRFVSDNRGAYSLVLVFDDRDVLEKHNLLRVTP